VLDLKGRGAIIVGTRRIGAVVAQRLAREGVRLAIVYRHSREEAGQLRERLAALTDHVSLLQADISVEGDVRRTVEQARREMGDLSFCINLAADYPRAPLDALDAAAWERGLAAAKGTYLLALHASRCMQQNPGPTRGHLLFCGDWAAGQTPYRDYLPYLTGKAAIDFMTRAFALELAPRGILVNAVLPGPSERPRDLAADQWGRVLARAPLHRESSAEEMAELIVTLLRSETITGETIRVDSGRHLAGAGPSDVLPI
jgi:NAD(P)-dependent dehydrogenase (short-subunit alcohol dehydrogenase family)